MIQKYLQKLPGMFRIIRMNLFFTEKQKLNNTLKINDLKQPKVKLYKPELFFKLRRGLIGQFFKGGIERCFGIEARFVGNS